jgi:hypothetical protein
MGAIMGSMGANMGLNGAIAGSMMGAVIGLMMRAISSMGAVAGSMVGAIVHSMGAMVGSVGANVGLMGRRRPSKAAIQRGLRVLAVAGMSWAGNTMIWRRLLTFVAAATRREGEAHGERRWTQQQQGAWPPMVGGDNHLIFSV